MPQAKKYPLRKYFHFSFLAFSKEHFCKANITSTDEMSFSHQLYISYLSSTTFPEKILVHIYTFVRSRESARVTSIYTAMDFNLVAIETRLADGKAARQSTGQVRGEP